MSGYFYLQRGLFNHHLFKPKGPLSSLEAWLWLIESANFSAGIYRHKNSTFAIPRGDYASSFRAIAQKWKWSTNRVIRELKVWQKENMIEVRTEHGFVQITVCNYSKYQDKRNSDGTLAEQCDGGGTATDTVTEHETSLARNTDGTLTEQSLDALSSWNVKQNNNHENINGTLTEQQRNSNGTLMDTVADTATDTNQRKKGSKEGKEKKEAEEGGGYFFDGRVVRLNQRDFESWQKAYNRIPDMRAELTAIDDKLFATGEISGWFQKISSWLRVKHEKAVKAEAVPWNERPENRMPSPAGG